MLVDFADGLRGAEQLMQEPVPFDDIVILFGGYHRAANTDGLMRLQRSRSGRLSREQIYRSVGELYFTDEIVPNYPYSSSPDPG